MTHHQQDDRPSRYLARTRRITWCVIVFERLWPLVLPLLLIAGAFVALAWFNVFASLPYAVHLAFLIIAAVLAIISVYRLRIFRLPKRADIDARIEAASGLDFQPLLAQDDVLSGNASTATKALWAEHRRRMRARLENLRSGYPQPDIPKHDPYALRAVVYLSLGIAFAFSFSPMSGHISDAFYLGPHADWQKMRIDAWVTPPGYTNRPPIYLTQNEVRSDEPIAVPQGSVATIRISDGDRRVKLSLTDSRNEQYSTNTASSTRILTPAENSSDNAQLYEVQLLKSGELQLSAPHTTQSWNFTVAKDNAPKITWEDEPKRAMNGMLELNYKIDDDFGGIKGWVVITPVDTQDPLLDTKNLKGQSLYTAPEIRLVMPRGGKGQARTSTDLTDHPWAGLDATMTLYVQDGAGNCAKSEPKRLTLPQRSFGNPLARAVVEQRRLLVLDTGNRNRVLDMLYAVLLRPQDTIESATNTIALQSARTRLSFATTNDALRNVAHYMWDIAKGIEYGNLSAAEQRLKQAQQALRDALRNGASTEEIERLMAELKQAMSGYLDELAQNGGEGMQPPQQGKTQNLSPDELEKKLKELEEMAKLGNRAAAEQLLSELEQLMNNVQVSSSGSGEGMASGKDGQGAKDRMQQKMDDLADMMRRQQDMLNDTNRLNQEHDRGEKSGEDYERDMKDLQKRQDNLRKELDELKEGLEKQGIKPDKELDDAGKSMDKSKQALEKGNSDQSIGDQADALDAMRRGAQGMMKQMREAMEKSGEGTPRDPNGLDPLGRDRADGKAGNDGDTKIPGEVDMQRARRILEEIRKRFGNMTPEMEKQYLERLLKFD